MSLNTLLSGVSHVAFPALAGGFNPMLRGAVVPLSPDGDAGALSMSDGVSLLTALDDGPADDVDAAADEADEGEGEDEDAQEDPADDQAADEEDAPDEDDPASDDDLEDDEAEGEPATAIAAPEFWSAEDKATFAKAPPEVQKVIAERFQEAETRVYAAKEEAAAARKEASIIGQTREQIDQLLASAGQVFQGKWDGVDWAQWAKEAPEEAIAARFEFDAEQELLTKMRTVQAATAAEEHRQFVAAETVKLAEVVPALADPKEGPARKAALITYLKAAGVPAEDLKWAGAVELGMAYKAMKYDEAQAALTRKPAPKIPTPAAKAPASVRPSGAAPPRKASRQRRAQESVGRVMKTGRMDDAVAALVALGE